jgi:hypothetical protein
MVTMPVAAAPLAVTVNESGCVHSLKVPAVIVVVVAALDAAKEGIASAIPSPAINSSRILRRKMPLTRTCSKTENRVPPHSAA